MTQRFCILLHDHPYWHWDFLLEHQDHALCWRLLRQPCSDEPIAAEQQPLHRLLYLDYAGPVSNDRGAVKRIDHGTYQIMATEPVFVIQMDGLNWAHQASLHDVGVHRAFWRFSAMPESQDAASVAPACDIDRQ